MKSRGVDTSDTDCPPATAQLSNCAIAQGDVNSIEKLVDMFGPYLKPPATPVREAEPVAEVPAVEVQPPSAAVHARDFQSDGFPKEGFIGTIPSASIHTSSIWVAARGRRLVRHSARRYLKRIDLRRRLPCCSP
jgi:hypothetical protein